METERIYTVTIQNCIACGKCELACSFAHGTEGKPGKSRINIHKRGIEIGTPVICFQCIQAACFKVCPVSAIVRNMETGALDVDYERCVNCRMCVAACPFGNMLWEEGTTRVIKCDLCKGDPKCVPFCPTKAIDYRPAPMAVKYIPKMALESDQSSKP
jgi:Fe-S-cluster-containing hydrogenase component 2